jgi:hypothetical protein
MTASLSASVGLLVASGSVVLLLVAMVSVVLLLVAMVSVVLLLVAMVSVVQLAWQPRPVAAASTALRGLEHHPPPPPRPLCQNGRR